MATIRLVLDVPYISTLPKATQNDIIESMWYSLNTIDSDNQKDRFINLYCNSILRDLWQESKSFAELSTDEIREIEQKLYKTVRNIVKIGGSPSYLSKVEAQYAKTEAGRWRKKFLEDEEWNKINTDKYDSFGIKQRIEKALKTLHFIAFSRLFGLAERKGFEPLKPY